MKWSEIRRQHPSKFILIGDVEEERLTQHSFRVAGGSVLLVSDDPKEIFRAYRQHKERGENVLYSLPLTPEDFVVEEEAVLGVMG